MNWLPSKFGAEPKKVAALAILLVVAVVAYLLSRDSGDSGPVAGPAPKTAATGSSTQRSVSRPASHPPRADSNANRNAREFRPSMKLPKGVDSAQIDPTLHLGALMRLQDVKLDGVSRSLFEISAAPPPELKLGKEPDKIKLAFVPQGPKAPGPPPPPPPTPRAPPIPLKFYGFVNPARPDVKQAFFFDPSNDDIMIAGEGDLIKKRYKILRIGINSAEVEDTQFKGDNTKQTLPLETESQG